MADLVICENQDLVNIADAIRSKTGQTGTMSIGAMSGKIAGITGGGSSEDRSDDLIEGNFTSWEDDDITKIRDGAFAYSPVTSANFPACTSIGDNAFCSCSSLTTANFPVCTYIDYYAFRYCNSLTNLTLETSTVCSLVHSNAFTEMPINSGTGYIYVPSSLVASYKTATNWTYYSNQILAIGESPDSGSSGDSGPSAPDTPDSENTFTINGEQYQMDEGMTWAEWCSSSYNTNNCFYVSELVSPSFNGYVMMDSSFVYNSSSSKVKGTDIINEGMAYSTVSGGGSTDPSGPSGPM